MKGRVLYFTATFIRESPKKLGQFTHAYNQIRRNIFTCYYYREIIERLTDNYRQPDNYTDRQTGRFNDRVVVPRYEDTLLLIIREVGRAPTTRDELKVDEAKNKDILWRERIARRNF